MDRGRLLRVNRAIALGLLLVGIPLMTGCTSGLFTVLYLLKGNDAPAECDILKEKKVAVVCRPVLALQYRNAHVDRDLAERVTTLLQSNVKKIKTVDSRKVAKWLDENTWEDFVEVGRKLDAEYVVGIDLLQFDLHQGQTLYQGRAGTELKVIDCKTGKTVFEKAVPQLVYPPNRMIPTSDRQESDFRREFLGILANQVARHFYPHDRYEDFALDGKNPN